MRKKRGTNTVKAEARKTAPAVEKKVEEVKAEVQAAAVKAEAVKEAAETKTEAAKEAAEAKAEAVKKAAEEKAEETKEVVEAKAEETKKAVETKTAEVKKAVEAKTKEVKTAVKKTAAKAAAKAVEVNTQVFVQYQNNEADVAKIEEKIKAQFAADGHRVGNIKKLSIYMKPEEYAAYYVINEKFFGRVDLF